MVLDETDLSLVFRHREAASAQQHVCRESVVQICRFHRAMCFVSWLVTGLNGPVSARLGS